jgi:hypothetical protein
MKFFEYLNRDGTKLSSMDFVHEMLEVIKSKSIDWKDVKYNYLDYLYEYEETNKEQGQQTGPSKEQ